MTQGYDICVKKEDILHQKPVKWKGIFCTRGSAWVRTYHAKCRTPTTFVSRKKTYLYINCVNMS